MIGRYLKIAYRNLQRNRVVGFINIGGYVLSASSFLLIVLYILNQTDYDKQHLTGDDLYRVETELVNTGNPWITATVSPPIIPALEADFPEVIRATRLVDPPETGQHILKYDQVSFFETKGYYVDSTFFDMFTYDWVEGTPDRALMEPYSVVLTLPVKEKLFGKDRALNQTIQIINRFGDNKFKVAGVVDPKTNKSHIRAHFYMSMNSGGIGEYVRQNNQWAGGNFIYGYVQLAHTTNPHSLESKFPAFLVKHGGDQFRETGMQKTLTLQPVKDIHLFSTRSNQLDTGGNLKLLSILSLIAFVIILIASINYMNLITARSVARSQDVSVRKLLGAATGNITGQYLAESFLIVGISFIAASFIAYLLIPELAAFTGENLSLLGGKGLKIGLGLIVFYALIALLSGSYPALMMARIRPVQGVKGMTSKGVMSDHLRKGLVVTQFAISLGLIIGSVIMARQIQYMKSKDLGFDRDNRIVIPFQTSESRDKMSVIKSEVQHLSGIDGLAGTRVLPGQFVAQDFNLTAANTQIESNLKLIQVDENYFKVLEIPILSGRNFTVGDTARQVVVNEKALQAFHINPDEAIGQRLIAEYQGQRAEYSVIGVVRDFNQNSLKDAIQPLLFEYRPTEQHLYLMLAIHDGAQSQLIAEISKIWKGVIYDTPFEWHFLNEMVEAQYQQDTKISKIIGGFTLLAIIIACLGLFGLALFMVEQKSKEIGIRKVLGATALQIVTRISFQFILLVGIALVIASPIIYWLMDRWLQNYEYQIAIRPWMFLIGGLAAMIIAFITVSIQSISAALANPIKSLRED